MTAPLPPPFAAAKLWEEIKGELSKWEVPEYTFSNLFLYRALSEDEQVELDYTIGSMILAAPESLPWRKWPDEKPGKDEEVYWNNQVHEIEIAHVVKGHWYTRDCDVYPCDLHPHWLPLSAIPGPGDE